MEDLEDNSEDSEENSEVFEHTVEMIDSKHEGDSLSYKNIAWIGDDVYTKGILVTPEISEDREDFENKIVKTKNYSARFPNLIRPIFVGIITMQNGSKIYGAIFEDYGVALKEITDPRVQLQTLKSVWEAISKLHKNGLTFCDELNLSNIYVKLDEDKIRTSIVIPHKIRSLDKKSIKAIERLSFFNLILEVFPSQTFRNPRQVEIKDVTVDNFFTKFFENISQNLVSNQNKTSKGLSRFRIKSRVSAES